MAKIEDGKGKNGDASVSTTQRLNVSAKIRDRTFYASRDDGLSFTAVYDGIAAAAGEYVAYLKNISATRNLFIRDIKLGGAEAIKWRIWSATGTAAAGEAVVPSQMNLSKNLMAEANAMAGNVAITGLTAGEQLGVHRSVANGEVPALAHGATILGPNDALVIEYESGTAGECSIEIHFHYEDLGAS